MATLAAAAGTPIIRVIRAEGVVTDSLFSTPRLLAAVFLPALLFLLLSLPRFLEKSCVLSREVRGG